ncbi:MAG: hypothetical protein CNLJKLNK_01356 [Holosporales bacterium]
MISGAVGAVTGEVLAEAFNPIADLRAEIYAEHPNFDALSKADQWSILQSKTDTHRKAWKLVSAITGGVFGGNANVAYQAADTAIENNYVHVVLAAMTIGYIGYVGYQVGSAIYDGDYEEALKTLGIEVVTFAVGGVVAKGAVAGGKIAFRFVGSTKTYATVAEALSAAYEKTPGLKLCMKSAHNKIITVFERFEGTSVGQKLGEWDARLAGRGVVADFEAPVVELESKKFIPKGWDRAEDFTFKGRTNKVYQRDDLIDLNRVDDLGKTNIERMRSGKPPISSDGTPINLHHTIQEMDGPILEITQSMHKENHGLLHIWPNKAAQQHGSVNGTLRREVLPEINRTEFSSWRSAYWQNRVKDLTSK